MTFSISDQNDIVIFPSNSMLSNIPQKLWMQITMSENLWEYGDS